MYGGYTLTKLSTLSAGLLIACSTLTKNQSRGGAWRLSRDRQRQPSEPVKRAVGAWNWSDVGPHDLFAPFNSFAKSVVLRVNEARDLGEVNRFQFMSA